MKVFFHGGAVVDGKGGIEGRDLLACGGGDGGGVAGGADEEGVAHEGGVGGDGLVEGAEEDVTLVFAEGAGLGVFDYSDDLVSGLPPVMRWPMGFSLPKSLWAKAWLMMATWGPVGLSLAKSRPARRGMPMVSK